MKGGKDDQPMLQFLQLPFCHNGDRESSRNSKKGADMAKHEWEIVWKNSNSHEDVICAVFTGGLSLFLGGCSIPTYTIRNSDGVEKQVTARDREELGQRIARGEFDD
jgi:hypothetical protein